MTIVPLTVNWGRDILRDRIDITTGEFYTRLRIDRELPHTAAPPLGIFEEVYRNLLASHAAVVSVHVAAELSGTYGVAATAARNVDAERIHVVDSTSVSIGLGWLGVRAAELARDGVPVHEIVSALEEMRERLEIYVALETLEYLQRGGRIGRAQAFLGGLLSVKPILHVQHGTIHPYERVRTRATSLRRLADVAAEAGPKELIAVAHGDADVDASTLRREIVEREQRPDVPVTEISAVVGVHTGPGLIGVGFLRAR
jgi:DegV family protein with EDD domain